MNPRTLALIAGGTVMAGLWYLAMPGHAPKPVTSDRVESADEPGLVSSVETRTAMPSARTAASAQAALAAAPDALAAEPPSAEELLARANALQPIDDQPLDQQEQYYKTSLEGAAHTRAMQRDLVDRLEAERDKGDTATRNAVATQIEFAQRQLAETETEIARYSTHVHESQ